MIRVKLQGLNLSMTAKPTIMGHILNSLVTTESTGLVTGMTGNLSWVIRLVKSSLVNGQLHDRSRYWPSGQNQFA